jgi:hypothetical protein
MSGLQNHKAVAETCLEPAVRTGAAGASAVSGVLLSAGTANPPGTGDGIAGSRGHVWGSARAS